MSLRLLGIVQHELIDYDGVTALPQRFAVLTGAAQRVAEEYWEKPLDATGFRWEIRPYGRRTNDPRADWDRGTGPFVEGPEGLSIGVGRRCLFLHTVAKLRVAVRRPTLLHAGYDLFRQAALILGSPGLLVWHDRHCWTWDLVWSGKTLAEIEDEIRKLARPVSNLHNLLSERLNLEKDDTYFAEWLAT